MISSKRISKLKKQFEKKFGSFKLSKFILKTKEGLFQGHTGVLIGRNDYTKVSKPMDGYEVYERCDKSIDNVIVIANYVDGPIIIDVVEERDFPL